MPVEYAGRVKLIFGSCRERRSLPLALSHGGAKNWSSAFLHGVYQGTAIGNSGLLGLDHERLSYRYSGRDFRLTDVAGVVAKKIIA